MTGPSPPAAPWQELKQSVLLAAKSYYKCVDVSLCYVETHSMAFSKASSFCNDWIFSSSCLFAVWQDEVATNVLSSNNLFFCTYKTFTGRGTNPAYWDWCRCHVLQHVMLKDRSLFPLQIFHQLANFLLGLSDELTSAGQWQKKRQPKPPDYPQLFRVILNKLSSKPKTVKTPKKNSHEQPLIPPISMSSAAR